MSAKTNQGRRWYQDRGVQAATIGGVFILLSSLVGAYVALHRPDPLPPLEIKTISGGGTEQVLATLAMRPENQVIDSTAFSALPADYILVNDTFGIAIQKPHDYRWTAGRLSNPGSLSWYDIPLIDASATEVSKMWGVDTAFTLPYFGVRLDHPFRLGITSATKVNGVPLGANPFRNPEIARTFTDYFLANDPDANWLDRQKYLEEITSLVDSLNRAKLPRVLDIYSGVFISPIAERTFPAYAGVAWHYLSVFEKAAAGLAQRLPPNNLLYVDRERQVLVFNQSVRLDAVAVDSIPRDVILNRVGYAIRVDQIVYLVQLQFLSGQDDRTLTELRNYFSSVRLRGPAEEPQ